MKRLALLSTLLPMLAAPRAAAAQGVSGVSLGGSTPSGYVTTADATPMHADTAADRDVAATMPLGPDAERELDAAFAIARRASMWRDTVTWSRVEADVRAIAAGSQSAEDTYPALRVLLTRLGDHHSFFMRPQSAAAFRREGAANPRPTVRVQTAGIGYIAVPAYGGGNEAAARSYVRAAHDSLVRAVANGAGTCRWILDLRANSGGNMWPMLGALHPFVGAAALGTFVTAGTSGPLWHAGANVDVLPPSALTPLDSANVAVLVGPRTASSGEAVAIAFIGRARTRTFGLPTAGLSTGNVPMALPDGAMLVVTTAVDADRTGKRYGHGIVPDEVTSGASADAPDDPQVDRAVAWLHSQSCVQQAAQGATLAVTKAAGASLTGTAGTPDRRR